MISLNITSVVVMSRDPLAIALGAIVPGGNGRPQGGMNRKNHHDSFGQSGQQKYGGGGQTRQPKYTPPKQPKRTWIDDLFSPPKKGKKRR